MHTRGKAGSSRGLGIRAWRQGSPAHRGQVATRDHQQSWAEPRPHLLQSTSLLPPPWAHAPQDYPAFRGRSLDCNTPDPIAVPSRGVPESLCFSGLGRAATRCSEDRSGVKQTLAKPWLTLQEPATCEGAKEENAHGAVCGHAPACSAGTLL